MSSIYIIALGSIPLALWGYALVTALKRWVFKVLNLRRKGAIPTLVVGNLSAGGTGKTPMILWLLSQYTDLKLGVLSRGYGRKTRGFQWVSNEGSSSEFGDEPLEIKSNYTDLPVAVSEDRLEGLDQMHLKFSELQGVVLDDGLQHLKLDPHKSVILSRYDKPYYNMRFSLPLGGLREFPFTAKYADAVIFTKCPLDLTKAAAEATIKKTALPKDKVFFAHYRQTEPLRVLGEPSSSKRALFISGVAEKLEFKQAGWEIVNTINYPDHQSFTLDTAEQWLKTLKKHELNLLILTRKDWQRIRNTHITKILSENLISVYETHTEVEVLWNQKEDLLQLLKPC